MVLVLLSLHPSYIFPFHPLHSPVIPNEFPVYSLSIFLLILILLSLNKIIFKHFFVVIFFFGGQRSCRSSTVESGLNLKVIWIKWHVIPSDRKFSQLFNGITCPFVSVGLKKVTVLYLQFSIIWKKLKKKFFQIEKKKN